MNRLLAGILAFGLMACAASAQTFDILHNFAVLDVPSRLTQDASGAFYGVELAGGNYGFGCIFRVETTGAVTVVHSFDGYSDGSAPLPLTLGADGNLYGVTSRLGTRFPFSFADTGHGTFFKYSPMTGAFALVVNFNTYSDPLVSNGLVNPSAPLSLGADGVFYGVSDGAVASKGGTIYSVTTASVAKVLATYPLVSNNLNPNRPLALVATTGGVCYAITSAGGVNGLGSLFRLNADGTQTTIHDFAGSPDGSNPTALFFGTDGSLYGGTSLGGAGFGTAFRLPLTGAVEGAYAKLADLTGASTIYAAETGTAFGFSGTSMFTVASGGSPVYYASLNGFPHGVLRATDGNSYASLPSPTSGGAAAQILKVTPDGAITTFAQLPDADDGRSPVSALAITSDGGLLGTASLAGATNTGTLFKIAANGTFTKIVDFTGTNGAVPYASFLPDGAGNFYGLTSAGGTDGGGGTFFKVTSGGVFTSLYSFQSGTHGAGNTSNDPETALVPGPTAGTFFGVSRQGGGAVNSAHGTIYSLTTAGVFTDLAQLVGQGGSLVAAGNGVYYGTTGSDGNQAGDGTIFKFTAADGITVLANFDRATTGTSNASTFGVATLTRASDGAIFGTTFSGGANNNGTVFQFSPIDNSITALYAFTGGSFSSTPSDGGSPSAPVIVGSDGNLYGTTSAGGPNNGGAVFQLTRAGVLTNLYGFAAGGTASGFTPTGALVQAADGSFYGTTSAGPLNGHGTVFHLSPNASPTPTPTPPPATPTPNPPPGSTPTPTPTVTPTPTPLPGLTPTPTPAPSISPPPTPTPTPTPAPLQIFNLSSSSGGDAGLVTITVRGAGFVAGSVVKLTGGGLPELVAVTRLLDGSSTLSATFSPTAAADGTHDLTVINPDGGVATLSGKFTISPANATRARMSLDVVGPPLARALHPVTYLLSVHNLSNIDALVVPVAFAVPSSVAVEVIGKAVVLPPAPTATQVYTSQLLFTNSATTLPSQAPVIANKGGASIGLFLLPVVAANSTATIQVRLTVTAEAALTSSPFKLTSVIGSPLMTAEYLTRPLTVTTSAATRGPHTQEAPLDYDVVVPEGYLSQEVERRFAEITADDDLQLLMEAYKIGEEVYYSQVGGAPLTIPEPSKDPFQFPQNALPFLEPDPITVTPGSPDDPNGKFGPAGAGVTHYISGAAPLPYLIDFENKATATLPAQRVVVTDVLDANVDLTTFSLGAIGFGGTLLAPPDHSSSYSADVDLRPALGLIVHIGASLDAPNRTVKWTFQSIDPATGLEPNDPTLGFLPPDLDPPSGEGFVSYTVSPVTGLATNTSIPNQASIIFDQNAAILTPVWTNMLDVDAPASVLKPIAAKTQPTSKIKLKISGTDAGSGVRSYSVWASDDGAPFRLILSNQPGPKITFNGVTGHKYKFFTQAVDAAGNEEPLKNTVEAKAKIVGPDLIGEWTTPITSKVNSGGKVKLKGTLTITNQSKNQPTLTGGVVRFFLNSPIDSPGVTSVEIGQPAPFDTLGGLESVSIPLAGAKLPVGAAATGYSITAVIDADGSVTETDETNNAVTFGPLP